jgi:hypothetical protein
VFCSRVMLSKLAQLRPKLILSDTLLSPKGNTKDKKEPLAPPAPGQEAA